MGGVIGKVTDAVGLTNNKGAKDALNSANDAADVALKLGRQQIELMKEGLEFQKQQLTDWKAVYGDIETNLGNYYKNLNANDLTAMGLQNQQAEFQAARQEIIREAAQRGISNSGLEYAATSNANIVNAQERARIRTAAPSQVAAEKSNFLALGLGQRSNIQANIGNAYSGVSTAYSSQIATYNNQFQQYLQTYQNMAAQNQDTMGSVIGTAVGFASGGPAGGGMSATRTAGRVGGFG